MAHDERYHRRSNGARTTLDDSSLRLNGAITAVKRHKKSNSDCGYGTALWLKPPMHAQTSLDAHSSSREQSSADFTIQMPDVNDDEDALHDNANEMDAFLLPNDETGSNVRGRAAAGLWPLLLRLFNANWLISIALLCMVIAVAYLARHKIEPMFLWIEQQDGWLVFLVFAALFIVVSFPIAFGYLMLLIAAGYLFGWLRGCLVVIVCANLGITIAHRVIHRYRHRLPIQRISRLPYSVAILRVISGPGAFKVALFTRLTPIPFGVQNTIFGISSISIKDYQLASFVGLLPAQIFNVYLGSTLRSMRQVLSNEGSHWAGFIGFGLEVICGLGLMICVLRKAHKELTAQIRLTNETTSTTASESQLQPLNVLA